MSGTLWTALVLAYLIGSIPFALIVHRISGRGDLRRQGSGNVGATNVFRSGARWAGVLTLILDIGKGAAGVALATALDPGEAGVAAAAFACVLGHCHPVWLRFRGGKGIATGCGAFGVIAPIPMALALATFLGVMGITRMVSAGSIVAGLALPGFILWWQPGRALLLSVLATVLLAVARHHGNIRRILTGREHRIPRGEGGDREA